jgi:hypothetical protein
MTLLEHAVHVVWPLVVVSTHRYVLDKLLAPASRYLLGLFKPAKVVEKLVDKAEEAIESKLEKKHEGENHPN